MPLRSYGAELEVQARPWANGTFSLNASYTNARYGDFGIYKTYFSTQKVSGVPPLQGNVAYDHRIPLGGDARLALRGVVRFFTAHDRSRLTQEWADLGAGPYGHVNSQALADFNATLIITPQFSITGYVRNLTDNRFLPDGWAIGSVTPSMTGHAKHDRRRPAAGEHRPRGAQRSTDVRDDRQLPLLNQCCVEGGRGGGKACQQRCR
ncbi:TonB-dependent receptor [Sphingomonas sp. BK036]|uniref:TonB-dependent receptor n=1 Tax=Sphingomonas sp. BK036 TaxID=2512122 RepID=UPI00102A83DB|nr:TonB-dependent receptor [Sphingomonas sp. BK036]